MDVSARPSQVRPTCQRCHRRPNAKQQVRILRFATAVIRTALAQLRGQQLCCHQPHRLGQPLIQKALYSYFNFFPFATCTMRSRLRLRICSTIASQIPYSQLRWHFLPFHSKHLIPTTPISITAQKEGGFTQRLRLIVESIGHKLTRTWAVLHWKRLNTSEVTTGLQQRSVNSKNVPPLST